jgi:hypothetical protein
MILKSNDGKKAGVKHRIQINTRRGTDDSTKRKVEKIR